MDEDTKKKKERRDKLLTSFLDEIKINGQWKKYLNHSCNQLHIADVCREMGQREGTGKPWDASFFRGANWGVAHKDTFNKWVQELLRSEREACDLLGEPLKYSVVLPKGLSLDGVAEDVVDFIYNIQSELKHVKGKISALECNLNSKERKVLELQTRIETMGEAYHAQDEHYMHSIRSLSYD
jgi:hypothetical protein